MTGTPQVSKAIKKHWKKLKIKAFGFGSGERKEVLIQFRTLDFEPLSNLKVSGFYFFRLTRCFRFFMKSCVVPAFTFVKKGVIKLIKKRGSKRKMFDRPTETQSVPLVRGALAPLS